MTNGPLISVVMAVYNGEDYLRGSIESILNQTYKNFEFIIVNDFSTDSTLNIIKSYNDKRIRVINNEKNLGQTRSLNVGIRSATGEYVARIDADDFSYPARIERQMDFFIHNPEFDLIGTSGHILDKSGKKRSISLAPTSQEEIFFRMFFDNPVIHISALAKREKILMLGGYDESFTIAQDYDLWSRFLINGFKIGNLKDILVSYRIHSGTVSKKNGCDKGIRETSEILYRNICSFTNLNIEREKAHLLRKICIVPVPEELSYKDCEALLNLFLEIFVNLKAQFKIKLDQRLIKATIGRFQHNIGMAMLRKGNLCEARKMFIRSINNGYASALPYIGYFLTFFTLNLRRKILDVRKRYIMAG